jgi:hypothetical protein
MLVPEVPQKENTNKPPPVAGRGPRVGELPAKKGYNFEILFFDKVVDFYGIVKLHPLEPGKPQGPEQAVGGRWKTRSPK